MNLFQVKLYNSIPARKVMSQQEDASEKVWVEIPDIFSTNLY